MNAQAVGDVFKDGFGEGVGFLEHHADPAAERGDIDRVVINILVSKTDIAFHASNRDGVIHAVE